MELTFTVVGIVFFVLGLNWFVQLDNTNQIEISELFDLKTRTYNVDNIKSITHRDIFVTVKGDVKSIDHYVIEMEDDYKWSSHVYGFFAVQKDKDAIDKKIDELSVKSGVTIQERSSK